MSLDNKNLGRLVHVADPRTIWTSESGDFTPWLAEKIDVLADALGMTLIVDTRGVYRTVESKILENDDLEKQYRANSRSDFYDSTDLWPAVISAILEACENHTMGVERLLDEGNRAKFLKALQAGGLYEKLRGDLDTGLPPAGTDQSSE